MVEQGYNYLDSSIQQMTLIPRRNPRRTKINRTTRKIRRGNTPVMVFLKTGTPNVRNLVKKIASIMVCVDTVPTSVHLSSL